MPQFMPISGLVALGLAAVSLTASKAKAADLLPEVRIASGVLRAARPGPDGVLAFKGIPYAAPPVGALRWRSPQPVANWEGPRDASRFGNRCLSAWTGDREPGPLRSEDCLTLNVWTQAGAASGPRPVMVWLHGGGFQFGSSASPQIDGTALAKKGVIVVTLNYRLGVLGFLAHPALDREGPSGNYGLQDQLAALRWVKANIARFGGNPSNVTLFGESAGAHAVGILMASPFAKGLFHKAIGESGAFWDGKNGGLESFAEAHARGTRFARKIGATTIAQMRAMPANSLNAAAPWDFTMNPMVTVFSPNVDRYVVPQLPSARFAEGRQIRIPLLAGWNAAEGYPFDALGLPHRSAGEFQRAAKQIFGPDRITEFLKLYPAGSDEEANESAKALAGDLVIGEQTWQWLALQRRTGRAPVYGYKFTYTSPYTPIASHITEVPFVFGTLTPQFIIGSRVPPAAADRAFSETMMSYWVNFAKRGNPNGRGLPAWPLFGNGGTLQNLGSSVAPQANEQEPRFRFIASFRNRGVFPARWRQVP